MTYRSGPCSFCDDEGRASCPRCEGWTCAAHGPADQPHCAICAKELKDDLDEVAFIRNLREPGEDRGMFTRRRLSLADALDSVASSIGRALDARRVQKKFARRSHADIAEWRRRAGITVRGA